MPRIVLRASKAMHCLAPKTATATVTTTVQVAKLIRNSVFCHFLKSGVLHFIGPSVSAAHDTNLSLNAFSSKLNKYLFRQCQ